MGVFFLRCLVFISAIVFVFAEDIVVLFGLGDEAAGYCLSHLRAVAFINIVLSMYIPLFGYFQGVGYSSIPAVVAVAALGTRVAVTYIFRYSPFLGYSVIWWNGIFGFGMGFLVTWACYLVGRWDGKRELG